MAAKIFLLLALASTTNDTEVGQPLIFYTAAAIASCLRHQSLASYGKDQWQAAIKIVRPGSSIKK